MTRKQRIELEKKQEREAEYILAALYLIGFVVIIKVLFWYFSNPQNW